MPFAMSEIGYWRLALHIEESYVRRMAERKGVILDEQAARTLTTLVRLLVANPEGSQEDFTRHAALHTICSAYGLSFTRYVERFSRLCAQRRRRRGQKLGKPFIRGLTEKRRRGHPSARYEARGER